MLTDVHHIHFIGIGGAGLSAIAKVLIEQGKAVSGSDLSLSTTTATLTELGARVCQGHHADNLGDAELVVVSAAVRADNPEWLAAQARRIPIIRREVLLGELMARKLGIGVAGTHGKTTTTAMLAYVLSALQLDPTFIVGGVMVNFNTNARAGYGEYCVIEADEYERMFLGLKPRHAIITSIEFDHPDCFKDEAAVVEAFQAFASLPSITEGQGSVVVCGDAPNARALYQTPARIITYGFGAQNAYRVIDPYFDPQRGAEFVIAKERRSLAVAQLPMPGRHNMLNACAVLALCDQLQLDVPHAARALRDFRGTLRRFEIKGERDGVTVVDDYAHNPPKVRAALAAAREYFGARRIWAVFQPHTYSRTKALLDDFAQAFGDADEVIVTDIYAARETDTLGVSSMQLVERITHPQTRYAPTLDAALELIARQIQAGDVLITLGAGDVNTIGTRFLQTGAGDAE
jgi:UDP-N-acetylmuramate--alanine ligase